MGFLKRLFSVGSKKNKKSKPTISNPTPLPSSRTPSRHLEAIEEDQEDAVNRLLRSSSSRYALSSERNRSSLDPLPHPINEVLQTPGASTASIASSTLSQRGTYTVTIHRRKQHATTEFPDANRGFDDTPSPSATPTPIDNDAHLLGLRRDPSVASLIDLYDDHGRLPEEAFSNSPPGGRQQTKRSGSTLRQLLGNPPPTSTNRNTEFSTVEGDISWAERFLGETESISSAASSYGLRTPDDPDSHFTNAHTHEQSFATDHDLSITSFDGPGISSLEVELSSAADNSFQDEHSRTINKSPYQAPDPTTPQRASQIFRFLTNKRHDDVDERSLPEPPSAFSSPSDEGCNPDIGKSHFSEDTSFDAESIAPSTDSHNIPFHTDTRSSFIHISTSTLQSAFAPRTPPKRSSASIPASQIPIINENEHQEVRGDDNRLSVKATPFNKVKVIMNGPTKVIVTAPTPCENPLTGSGVRIPRGPRAPSGRRRTGHSRPPPRPRLAERSNSTSSSIINQPTKTTSRDSYTAIPSRHKRVGSRTSSQISVVDVSFEQKDVENMKPGADKRPVRPSRSEGSRDLLSQVITSQFEKENASLGSNDALTAVAPLPFTPMRTHSTGRSSLFRTAVTPSMFRPPPGMAPSPASSSELSPVAKEMMLNLRQQRTKAREAERERGKKRSVAARI
ncbi:hypothetical protein BDN71DRAFT_1020613 [Pleurotus eryngii]|uniref:Uncharacterized protein n=1 Tax=Pleurotus eryngii TaxID=5323 RepID=A0A9P5ZYF5_PLEER|nr:hypothetical protein BDN71DRAFT_1020613 [Pleurotus eryngii]